MSMTLGEGLEVLPRALESSEFSVTHGGRYKGNSVAVTTLLKVEGVYGLDLEGEVRRQTLPG